MSTLAEIINSSSSDINVEFKRAFRPLSPNIDITDNEDIALIILTNLTAKVDAKQILTDRENCRKKLKDNNWWSRCINTMKFRQSHNVKFPEIKATGIIRADPIGEIPKYFLSSSKLKQKTLPYANDSKDVSIANFLTSEFILNGKICCLGVLLADEQHPLWDRLTKLGCYQKTRKYVAKQLEKIPNSCIEVHLGANSVRQISLPDGNNSYLSLSPVTSQTMQSSCYQSLHKHYWLSKTTRYSRASNMGVLPMTCGGALRMLTHTISFEDVKHCQISPDSYWLTKDAIQAFYDYFDYSNWLMPHTQKQQKLKTLKITITEMISRWLSLQKKSIKDNNLDLVHKLNFDLSNTKSLRQFAYDPKTTRFLFTLIENKSNTQQPYTSPNENFDNQYLLLPQISVCGASAISSPITIGIPSLTAFYGFIHAFERNAQKVFSNLKVDSFAICIHTFHLQKRGMTRESVIKLTNNISPPATHDEWHCDLKFSLVLKINNLANLNQSKILYSLPKRLAGGCARISIDDIKTIQVSSSFKDLVKQIPTFQGQWLSLYKTKIDSFENIIQQIKASQNITPTCVGYHYLEKPTERPFALRDYNHVFAEPIIGLIKPITIKEDTNLHDLFWNQINKPHYTTIETRNMNHEDPY
ncbi:type I-F CRISPR-associated protein Csy2 [Photobacterium andalusiense]|uniref:CRISPR-associated protein Csy2 n=1 Tax=Photobacterium andalusiense TaxID=2204296 RepID=A0A1Y6MEP9_9GAMM|nr:type I-F CRISPR-associated protein Csy2 [Photobacterium andalusiense]SMY35016.1 CRISPR-associated protein Csy2 [Photobacterium andalusiense]